MEVRSERVLEDKQGYALEKRNGQNKSIKRNSIFKNKKKIKERGTLNGPLNSESNSYRKIKTQQ